VAAGLTVIVGGFHVSGSLAMLAHTPPEIQELMDLGVGIVKGEVEEAVLAELRQLRKGGGLARVKLNQLRIAYDRARESLPQLDVPGRFRLLVRKWSPFSLPAAFYSSRDVLDFWGRALERISRGRFSGIDWPVLLSRLWHDTRLSIHCAFDWRRGSAGGRGL
jgi:hypothetical protein